MPKYSKRFEIRLDAETSKMLAHLGKLQDSSASRLVRQLIRKAYKHEIELIRTNRKIIEEIRRNLGDLP